MIDEKLAQHFSNNLWISKDKIVEVLGSYEETKHLIKLVNEEPKQRDYTGVRFYRENGEEDFIIGKDSRGWFTNEFKEEKYFRYTDIDVLKHFSNGTWIKLPQEKETPNIHVEKPNTLEERIKRIEEHLKL
jgi:hypothetical protein